MIYLMLWSKRCGHLFVFPYNHHRYINGFHFCRCGSKP